MQEHIPDIPVLPVPGNHEYFPVSVSEFNDDNDIVLHTIGEDWKPWLTKEAAESFILKGYYSMLLNHPKLKNTRVIGMNT